MLARNKYLLSILLASIPTLPVHKAFSCPYLLFICISVEKLYDLSGAHAHYLFLSGAHAHYLLVYPVSATPPPVL